jgi:hypothetical protein
MTLNRMKETRKLRYVECRSIVIYARNGGGQHYKTVIAIVSYAPNFALALASVINYDCK